MAQHRTTTRRQSTVTKQTHTPPPGPDPKLKDEEPRRVGLGKYKSFRLQKRSLAPAYEDRGVPSGTKLLKRSLKLVWKQWKLLGGITLIFGCINFALAGGSLSATTFENTLTNLADRSSGTPIDPTKNTTPTAPDESSAGVVPKNTSTGLTLLSLLISSGGGNGITASTTSYQFLLFMLSTLALIWSLRQIYTGKRASIRGAWYFGTAALVPFILVLGVLLLECIPVAVGSYMVYTLIGQGITITFLENALVVVVFALLAIVSAYWVSGSIFALQIITLPEMTPIRALRSSHELTRYRRALVLRRLMMFGLVFVALCVFLIVPLAFTVVSAAPPVFFIALMLTFTVFQTYLYNLYRELIG